MDDDDDDDDTFQIAMTCQRQGRFMESKTYKKPNGITQRVVRRNPDRQRLLGCYVHQTCLSIVMTESKSIQHNFVNEAPAAPASQTDYLSPTIKHVCQYS